MSNSEKRSANPKFTQEVRRGDKEIDDIKAVIEFCTMSPELKSECIEKTRDAMRTTIENNSSYFKNLAKKIKVGLENEHKEIWNVIVGTDYGAWINFDKTNCLYFRMDEIYFLIFRFGYDTK